MFLKFADFFNFFLAFTLVDKGPFRRLLKYQCPQTSEADIPHRTKLREEIMKKVTVAEEHIRKELEVSLKPYQVDTQIQTFNSCRIFQGRSWSHLTLGHPGQTIHTLQSQPTTSLHPRCSRIIGNSTPKLSDTQALKAITVEPTPQRWSFVLLITTAFEKRYICYISSWWHFLTAL